jgi:hypothetical protein
MALLLKSDTSINALGTELYIEFLEATGDYHVDDNPGGFGAPNPTRNSLAIFLYAVHKKVAGDVAASIVAYNEASVESFTVNINSAVNGVLDFFILAVPFFVEEGVYEDDDIVYDITSPSTPIFKKMVEGEWVPILITDLLADETIDQQHDFAFPIPDAIAFSKSLNAQQQIVLTKKINGECVEDDFKEAITKFRSVDSTIKVATDTFCSQGFNQAQIKIEEVLSYQAGLTSNE